MEFLSLEYIRRPEQQKKIKSKGKVYHDNRKLEFLNDNKLKTISTSINSIKVSKEKGKGKHASSTESRRVVWEFIVWPLILQVNRQYFTILEYRRKMNEFTKVSNTQSGFPKLSGGLISLVNRGILVRNNNLYSIHYRLIPYMRKKVKLEYGQAFREIYSKH
jgi:hypothetical protein